MLSFGIRIHEGKKQFVLDPTLEKEEGFQFQGMNRKNGVRGGKPISQMQCKPYDINLDEGFTAIKDQENNNNNNNKKRDIHSHTIVLAYIRTNIVLW